MDDSSNLGATQRIDLTRQLDVAYWCRIFDVSAPELREAVHHAGHQVPEIRRYLAGKFSQPLGQGL